MTQPITVRDLDVVGFDLDHTIIKYRLPPTNKLIHDCIAEFLLARGYDTLYLQDFDDTFGIKGLVFELTTGNFFTIDEMGRILKAFHGTRPLSQAEIHLQYSSEPWQDFAHLKDFLRSDRFVHFNSYFNVPVAYLCARLVEMCDAKSLPYMFWPDIVDGFRYTFTPEAFLKRQGSFFTSLADHTEKYIYKRDDVRSLLGKLTASGITVFLLTNSHADYTNMLLNFAIGPDWRSLFDLVLVNGDKPNFFEGTNPFYLIDEPSLCQLPNRVPLQINGRIYSGGNVQELNNVLRAYREERLIQKYGQSDLSTRALRVAYVGDNLHGDIVVVTKTTNWYTIAVVEETNDDHLLDIDDHGGALDVIENRVAKSRRRRAHEDETDEYGNGEVINNDKDDDGDSNNNNNNNNNNNEGNVLLKANTNGGGMDNLNNRENGIVYPMVSDTTNSFQTLKKVRLTNTNITNNNNNNNNNNSEENATNNTSPYSNAFLNLSNAVDYSRLYPFGRGYLRKATARWGSFFLASAGPGISHDTPSLTLLGKIIVSHSAVIVPCITWLSLDCVLVTPGTSLDYNLLFPKHVPHSLRAINPAATTRTTTTTTTAAFSSILTPSIQLTSLISTSTTLTLTSTSASTSPTGSTTILASTLASVFIENPANNNNNPIEEAVPMGV